MNNTLVTTGLIPLTIGSTETFQLSPFLNGLPWPLLGGTINLLLTDPQGNNYNFPAGVLGTGYGASFTWLVAPPTGTWTRAWKVVDANGVIQVSRPIVFNVISSPS